MMPCIPYSRGVLLLLFPCLIYVMHILFVLLSACSVSKHQLNTDPKLVLIMCAALPAAPKLKVKTEVVPKRIYIYGRQPGPNITDILVKKKMGGLLKEMGAYKRLMKEALEKGKASKGKKVQKGFEKESLDMIEQMYKKNVTNFFHILTMDVVVPFTAGYVINNETLCSVGNHPLTYLIYVHSAPGNAARCKNMRCTWAQPDIFPWFPSRIVFFVGQVAEADGRKQAQLELKARKYGDIVQVDFVDTYHNLTYKAMGAMRWISEFCPNTHYVFKTDDDVYVNMPAMMLRLTTEFAAHSHFFMGTIWGFPSLHIQHPGKLCSKWCIPFNILPGLDQYATYASGSFYIMTQDFAAQLYDMAMRTPFFWVDDAHITGIVAARIPDLEHIDISKAYRFKLSVYKEKLETSTPLIVTLTQDLVALWKYHLPWMDGPRLALIGDEKHKELLDTALNMS